MKLFILQFQFSNCVFTYLQDDCATVDETGHRRQPAQGNFSQGSGCYPVVAAQALQSESCLPVRIHVAAFGFRQLHSSGVEILQPKHHGLRRRQKQVRIELLEKFHTWSCQVFRK